jgi:surface polysaccharide O-acyltransferase-like enzyme
MTAIPAFAAMPTGQAAVSPKNPVQHSDGMDLLRALACLMVVLAHCAEFEFMTYSPRWLASIFYDAFFRAAVPVFLMITGFLLLDKDEPIGKFYTKRFTRVVLPFLFYSVLYLVVDHISIFSYITRIYIGAVAPHLWYVYVLIGIYLFMPFLRKIFNHSTVGEKMFYVGAWLILSVVFPTFNRLFSFRFDPVIIYHLDKFTGYIGYVFLGACLKQLPRVNRPAMAVLYMLSAVCIMILFYLTAYKVEIFNPIFIENQSPFICLTAIGLFLWLRDAKITHARPLVLSVSQCSYGIYLLHFMLVNYLYKHNIAVKSGPAWITIPAVGCLVFAVTYGCIFSLRKIRFLDRLVG